MVSASVPELPGDIVQVQLDRRLATIHADRGLVGMQGDVLHILHVIERMARDKQVLLAGDEVLEQMLAVVFEEIKRRVAALAAAMAAAAADGVVARTALRVSRAGASRGAVARTAGAASGGGDLAVGEDDDALLAARLKHLQRRVGDDRLAKGPRYGGVAFLADDVVAAGAEVDRVVARKTMLGDRPTMAHHQSVVAAADDDGAIARDVDIIVTVTRNDGAPAKNGYVNVSATRNTDASAHWTSPLIRTAQCGNLVVCQESSWHRNVTKAILWSQSRFNLIVEYLSL